MSESVNQDVRNFESWRLEAVLIPAEGEYSEYVSQISLERINLRPYLNTASEDDLDSMLHGDYDWILPILNSNVVEISVPYEVIDINDINWDAVREYVNLLRQSRV